MENFINKILITNDDGFDAVGLQVLKSIAYEFCDTVYVVSPKHNQSAKSRSITLKDKINFEHKGQNEWVVDGCLLYTSPSPRDKRQSRMPSSA